MRNTKTCLLFLFLCLIFPPQLQAMVPGTPEVSDEEMLALPEEDEALANGGPSDADKTALEEIVADAPTHDRESFLKRLLRPITPSRIVSSEFRIPPALAHRVEFWKKIFTQYDSSQIVIHDTDYLVIYDSFDVSDISANKGYGSQKRRRLLRDRFREAQNKHHRILRSLHAKSNAKNFDPSSLTEEELRLYQAFDKIGDPDKFWNAHFHSRMRAQYGMRDHFIRATQIAGGYLAEMEQIFTEEGLPVELTRLPFIESSFNIRAYSKVGAAGIWQFMRSTGKLFLRIDEAIDERRDPIASTRGAARLLKRNYDILGSWPLAITAYNHGPRGIMRAVETCKTTDLATLIGTYKGRSFGFASKNFYAEFLAAVEISANHEKYFGKLDLNPVEIFDEVSLNHFLSLDTLARHTQLDHIQIAQLNPAFTPAVAKGRLRIPRNYPIRLPMGTGAAFLGRYSSIPEREKFARQYEKSYHTVSRGDTLSVIAKRYNARLSEIMEMNALNTHRIRVGQVLAIPVRQ